MPLTPEEIKVETNTKAMKKIEEYLKSQKIKGARAMAKELMFRVASIYGLTQLAKAHRPDREKILKDLGGAISLLFTKHPSACMKRLTTLYEALKEAHKPHSDTCPECDEGKVYNDKSSLGLGTIDCPTCKGTGVKPPSDEPKFNNALEADAHNWDTRELVSDEELGEKIEDAIQFFGLRFAELQSQKWLESGKPDFMDTTEIHKQAMDEAIDQLRSLLQGRIEAAKKEGAKEENQRMQKYIEKKYFNDGLGVSKNESRTARYAVAKGLLLNLVGQALKEGE